MPIDIPVGFGQVLHSIEVVGDNERMAITYGIQLEGTGAGVPQNAVDGCAAVYASQLNPQMGNTVILRQTELRFGSEAGPPGVAVSVLSATGAQAIDLLPQNCAYLVDKRTALAGRRGRGRFYIPGVPEDSCSNIGIISQGKFDSMNLALAGFLTGLANHAAIVGMVLLHSVGPLPTLVPTPVTSLVLQSKIATQRRRLRK
jgi:hypothetical protein